MARLPTRPMERGIFSDLRDDAAAHDRFVSETTIIRRAWGARRRGERRSDGAAEFRETAHDWMMRYSYLLIGSLIRADYARVLDRRIAELGIRSRGRFNIEDQPFKKGLLAMFGWEEPRGMYRPLMSRQMRSELGDAMEYAFRHQVPPKYLCGFIKQSGQRIIPEKLRAGYREPGFD